MRVKVTPSVARGCVAAPPSKSDAHRALICAALSGGSTVKNLAWSADIKATYDCLHALGAFAEKDGDFVKIGRLDPFSPQNDTALFANESGSTLRFLLPLLMLSGKKLTITGSERLFARPLSIYEDICREQNIVFERTSASVTVCGKLAAGHYAVRGDISSQFISGLLFALPLLSADSTLEVTGRFESASYVDLTLATLSRFGIEIKQSGNTFYIRGGQKYTAREYEVEGDCSNAAFLDGLNVLGGTVETMGLRTDTLQGDRVYKKMYEKLGNDPAFNLSDCPDLGPVMFALAAATGGARFVGTERLRIKESDRIETMKQELAKLGAEVLIDEDGVTVGCSSLKTPSEPLCGHNDHRIVMALTLLLTKTGGELLGAEAVAKSFPDFFEKIKSLGIGIEENDT